MFFTKPVYNVRLLYYSSLIMFILTVIFCGMWPIFDFMINEYAEQASKFASIDQTKTERWSKVTMGATIIGMIIGIILAFNLTIIVYFLIKYFITNSKNV